LGPWKWDRRGRVSWWIVGSWQRVRRVRRPGEVSVKLVGGR
jgi:hypothetical protein